MADPVERIDAYPYSTRVAALMTPEPVYVEAAATLADAAQLIASRRISSVLVHAPDGPGIVTERDIIRQLAASGAAALAMPCGQAMTTPLVSVARDDLLHVAIGRMSRFGLRHLVVVDALGVPCGILTARILLAHRSSRAMVIGDEIAAARDAGALREAHDRLPAMAEGLRGEGVPPLAIAGAIASFYRALTRRAAELAEREAGGTVPRYAMLVLGSGGRGESLLAGDQDNAIVHDLPPGADDAVLVAIARRACDLLDEAGLPYCKGGVMASNVLWRRPLDDWRETVAGWAARAQGDSLLNVDIFFDAVCVHGDAALADVLRGAALDEAARALLPRMMADEVQAFRPPLGPFGGFRSEQGRGDLKLGGLFPLVAGARAMALRHGIAATATRERLAAVAALGLIGDEDLGDFCAAHDLFLGLILDQQIADLAVGRAPGPLVDVERLDRAARRRLKVALHSVARLPGLVLDVAARG